MIGSMPLWTRLWLVQLKACLMFGVNPLHEPQPSRSKLFIYTIHGQNYMGFEPKYILFPGKFLWKYQPFHSDIDMLNIAENHVLHYAVNIVTAYRPVQQFRVNLLPVLKSHGLR